MAWLPYEAPETFVTEDGSKLAILVEQDGTKKPGLFDRQAGSFQVEGAEPLPLYQIAQVETTMAGGRSLVALGSSMGTAPLRSYADPQAARQFATALARFLGVPATETADTAPPAPFQPSSYQQPIYQQPIYQQPSYQPPAQPAYQPPAQPPAALNFAQPVLPRYYGAGSQAAENTPPRYYAATAQVEAAAEPAQNYADWQGTVRSGAEGESAAQSGRPSWDLSQDYGASSAGGASDRPTSTLWQVIKGESDENRLTIQRKRPKLADRFNKRFGTWIGGMVVMGGGLYFASRYLALSGGIWSAIRLGGALLAGLGVLIFGAITLYEYYLKSGDDGLETAVFDRAKGSLSYDGKPLCDLSEIAAVEARDSFDRYSHKHIHDLLLRSKDRKSLTDWLEYLHAPALGPDLGERLGEFLAVPVQRSERMVDNTPRGRM